MHPTVLYPRMFWKTGSVQRIRTYGPYAVIVFFGCWRLAARRSKESRREFSWKSVGWRVLAALALLVVSFLLGVRH
jgi:hypothetical protein